MNLLIEKHLIQIQEDSVSKAYGEYLIKAKQKCKSIKGIDKRQCMTRAQIEAKKAQLRRLKKMAGECRSAQDPTTCHRKMMIRAQKINDSVKKLMLKYRENAVRIQQKQKKEEEKSQQ